MSFTVHSITYGSQTINFELRRSMRKTLTIHVHPDMRIEIIAPATAELEKIEKKFKNVSSGSKNNSYLKCVVI